MTVNSVQTLKRRYQKRTATAGFNVLRHLLVPLSQFILAKVAIDQQGTTFWGQIVGIMIYVQLAAMLTSWGQKEYSLREMSLNPAKERHIWNRTFWTRTPLLLAGILILSLSIPSYAIGPVIVWTCSLFAIQSFESLVLARNKTQAFGISEIVISFLFIAIIWWLRDYEFMVGQVLWLLAGVNLARALYSLMVFRSTLIFQIAFDWGFFKKSLPFFLLGLSGMLFSKVDLYVADFYLSESDLGQYQLFITAFIQIQAMAGFILMPFAKNLFRLRISQILSLAFRFFLFGILITSIGALAIRFLLKEVYSIELEHQVYALGFLFASSTFFCLPIIHYLYGQKLEKRILVLNWSGFVLNLTLSIALIIPLGFKGLILATAIAQLLISVVYLWFIVRENRK